MNAKHQQNKIIISALVALILGTFLNASVASTGV